MIEDVKKRLEEISGRDDIEIVGGDNPTICGRISLVPFGYVGNYIIFKDAAGKLFAAPCPFGFSSAEPIEDYYSKGTA